MKEKRRYKPNKKEEMKKRHELKKIIVTGRKSKIE